MNDNFMHSNLTDSIIKAAYEVYNYCGGSGFLEIIYEKSLMIELQERGYDVESQVPIEFFYKGRSIGDFRADLIVEDKVIVELKAIKNLQPANESQLVSYLKSSKIEVGLLLNFGADGGLQIKRKVYSNQFKNK